MWEYKKELNFIYFRVSKGENEIILMEKHSKIIAKMFLKFGERHKSTNGKNLTFF